MVVLKTESEDVQFFFKGFDQLELVLYLKLLLLKHHTLRVDVTSLLFK